MIRVADRVFIHEIGIRSWIAQHIPSGICAVGESAAAAVAAFKVIWADRSEVAFVMRRPPAPLAPGERPSEVKQLAEAQVEIADRGAEVFAKLMHQFHPDHAGDARFSAEQVATALVELRNAMRGM